MGGMDAEPQLVLVMSPSEGSDVPCAQRFDPLRVAAAPFLDLIRRLDQLANGPAGRVLPGWAFYDCAELPGAVACLARPAGQLPERVRRLLEVPAGYAGAVPIAQAALIPTADERAWHLYVLASLHWVEPDLEPADLCPRTVMMAIEAVGVTTAYAAAPWRSPNFAAITQLAPLELLTAWTPAHSEHSTATCRFAVATPRRDESAGATSWIATDDDGAQRQLQSALEDGQRFEIIGPVSSGGVPLREVACP
jgi:hypothetical protein